MMSKSVVFIICFMIYACCLEVMAENVAGKTKELSGLQAKIKQISLTVNDLKTQKNSLLATLKKLDTQYGRSALQLNHLAKEVGALNAVLKDNRRKISKKKSEINAQKYELGRQVRAAYAMGRNEKLKVMLNQQDPTLSGRMISYYDYLNKARLEKISRIDEDLQVLSHLESEQAKETALLESKLDKRKQERSVLLKTKSERKALLLKIDQQVASKKQQLSQFKASEKRLKSLILSLQQALDVFPLNDGAVKSFSKLKGKLPWPLKGELLKKFGDKRSDSRWDGVLIKAKAGENIRVVTRGRVVYADWLRGYGLLTIIDHGKGYMTLYAFNQSLYKSVGDWVDAGAVIATVGQSGGQSSAGLYFGVRRKGKPVDPVKWCRKVRRGKVG